MDNHTESTEKGEPNSVAAGAGGESIRLKPLNSGDISDADEKPPPDEFLRDSDDLSLDPDNLHAIIESIIGPIGLEIHPFLIGWYNEKVGPKFQLNYPDDTLAFVVINGPDMFEKCIIPYVKLRLEEDPEFRTNEPIDDSMKHAFTIVKEDLLSEGLEVDVFHDFDLHPSRRPKVLVQTAAHVAGAVQYLHKNSLSKEVQVGKFSQKSNLSGVAIHPDYGGWYGIRGVIIFTNLPERIELKRPEPLQIFSSEEIIAHTIELFAYNWQTNEWRNIHEGLGRKYSSNFLRYLDLEPSLRWDFISDLLEDAEVNPPEIVDN